jgi:hypothetical protein
MIMVSVSLRKRMFSRQRWSRSFLGRLIRRSKKGDLVRRVLRIAATFERFGSGEISDPRLLAKTFGVLIVGHSTSGSAIVLSMWLSLRLSLQLPISSRDNPRRRCHCALPSLPTRSRRASLIFTELENSYFRNLAVPDMLERG